jgi:membrane protein DedA with SNARE-associated domain/rhodanese-related sulfurtransferase
MKGTLEFLVRHGYMVLYVWVVCEQIGLPVPSIPMLLAAGALAGAGRMNLAVVILLAVLACMTSDLLWYQLGLQRGGKVLQWICKISLEPDSCVRRTEDFFLRLGPKSLLIAKFLPGLNAAAAPVAGILRIRRARFIFYDALGSLFWAGTIATLGYVFSDQLEDVAVYALRLGLSLAVLIFGGLAGYILWKYLQRKRFIRTLRIARITAQELKQKLDAGETLQILDLRQVLDFEANPSVIPGALQFDPKEIENRQVEIPRDREIILYCSCPNEATSARAALLLRNQGISRVRPLLGGLDAWKELGYPLQMLERIPVDANSPPSEKLETTP